MRTICGLLWLILIPIAELYGQNSILDKTIHLPKTTATLEQLLGELSQQAQIPFSYSNQLPLQKQVTVRQAQQTLRRHLDDALLGQSVLYVVQRNKIILRISPRTAKPDSVIRKVTIRGLVRDSASGEALMGASLYIRELAIGTTTNTYGFFALTVPRNTYTLTVSHMGYRPLSTRLPLVEDQRMDINLPAIPHQLAEVVVSSETANNQVTASQMSSHRLNAATIRQMPALAGEPDVLKSIQLLPGVTTVGEGSTGFSVRGGGLDQNLILLDEAPVYNPAHFLGFLSVFNTDAIKDVSLYKGGIPAQYGGRASSVLAIQLKEGNTHQFRATGGVGVLGGARLSVEGPLAGGKGSYILSGRRTFTEPFLWLGSLADSTLRGTNVNFYDGNLKLNYTLNEKNKVYLSGYFGRDMNRLPLLDYQIQWGNATGTLRWNHLFSQRLFSNFTLLYSRYQYRLRTPAAEAPFSWESAIEDKGGKADFTWFVSPRSTVNFGLHSVYHQFRPGQNRVNPGLRVPGRNALETALYAGVDTKLSSTLRLEAGLRYSLFQNMGHALVYQYNQAGRVVDSIAYGAGTVYHSYAGVEPRLSIRYQLADNQSIKAGYNRLYQYVHQLTNSSLSFTSFDIWYPSGPTLPPIRSDQVSLGYFRSLGNRQWEVSLEGYYKFIAHQLDVRDHAQLTFNPYLEAELRTGRGWSYGLEFFVQKQTGRLTGWANYTFSRAWRQLPAINEGQAYPALYDQPHKVSLTAGYKASKRVNLGLNWLYNTGGVINLPVESFAYENQNVPVYGARNASRLPDYHRLDLSATVRQPPKPGRRWTGSWVYTITNVYARKNPLTIYVGEDLSATRNPTQPRLVANRVYLFSIIPSVSYQFSF
ncbi:TonB-dependent receptor [Larkinella harenae]